MKICSKCKEIRSFNDFTKDKRQKDKLFYYCKFCEKIRREKRKERSKLTTDIWREKNKEKHFLTKRRWNQKNSGKVNAWNSRRRTSIIQRMPKWLSKEQVFEMEQLYIEASIISYISGIKQDIDHIIPLHGKNVSGLHVPWNLQILPETLNCSKWNKF